MGKKDKPLNLGRSLIKNRFGGNKERKFVADKSMLHTTEVQDGYDWGRLNLQSVTEESSFQEFLSIAELTGNEFQAEKLNVKFINSKTNGSSLTNVEIKKTKDLHNKHKEFLKIPRRPQWNPKMTSEELNQNEKDSFIEWRRSLAKLQDDEGILLTPYEKNLEFWRQLWRVVEKSDVLFQIVDARNPLLFRCEDLERYVKEVSPNKMNFILVNKADFLTEEQRQSWADYFTSIEVRVVFYSALLTSQVTETSHEELNTNNRSHLDELKKDVANLESEVEKVAQKLNEITDKLGESVALNETKLSNSKNIASQEELIELFRHVHKGPKVTPNITTIGLVGYPNVGKSSTINSLFSSKKVSVSATPGKTKHFQTLFLDKDILICDCPGLVMPSFVFTKAEMILNGILPIDQMRDHMPPVDLVANLIPKHVIEDKYGIMLPSSREEEEENQNKAPLAEELLNAYGYTRGFITANGQPDNPRAARYILKDFVNGKLLYCYAPPNVSQADYQKWPERQKIRSLNSTLPPRQLRAIKPVTVTTEDVNTFFHVKGISNSFKESAISMTSEEKPWKKFNKHHNKNKKEKLRRVYAHLDQH